MSLIPLYIGIVLLPFFELIMRIFPLTMVLTPDSRIAKAALGVIVALSVGLFAIYNGVIKRCHNIWLLLLIFYLPVSIHLAPQFKLVVNGVDSTNYWVWKPFAYILSYFIMFMGVQSLNITKANLSKILNIMSWVGFFMAAYMILQSLGWDQFFELREGEQFRTVTQRGVGGNLGQSTIVSPFVAMIIPLALYCRKRFLSIVMLSAVFISQSIVAIGAMIGSLLAYSCLKWRKKGIYAVILIILLTITGLSWQKYLAPKQFTKISSCFNGSGRYKVWRNSIDLIKNEKLGDNRLTVYPYTGAGLGSYSIIFKKTLKTIFGQAHNEYIEIFCTLGLFGLILFIGSIFMMLREAWRSFIKQINMREIIALTSSFLCIAAVAMGSFPWQIPPTIFYTVIAVGLLHNPTILKGELE